MALEFHILKGSGNSYKDYSDKMASFEENEYQSLIDLAREANLPIFASMSNYYGEYKIAPTELDSFLAEVQILIPKSSQELQVQLKKLVEIINQAKLDNLTVATFPD